MLVFAQGWSHQLYEYFEEEWQFVFERLHFSVKGNGGGLVEEGIKFIAIMGSFELRDLLDY